MPQSHKCKFPAEDCARCAKRLFSKFKVGDGCWEWTDHTQHGYGRMWINKKTVHAHRLVWQWSRGKIPNGLCLDHLCRNRKCVNPKHLEVVTLIENVRRGMAPTIVASRTKLCRIGHALSQIKGQRRCLICMSKWNEANALSKKKYQRAFYLRNREERLARQKAYYIKHKGRILEYAKGWRKRNASK